MPWLTACAASAGSRLDLAQSSGASDEMLACALVPLLDARTVLYKTYLKLDNAVKGWCASISSVAA